MEQLRQGIGMQAFAQRNPVDEYKAASYDMLDAMNDAIRTDTVQMLYRIRIEKKPEREEVAQVTGTNKDDSASNAPKKRAVKKVYPNDPCPCGSGKKYKNCCGK
jgi:preprotein translocase subunit SecA